VATGDAASIVGVGANSNGTRPVGGVGGNGRMDEIMLWEDIALDSDDEVELRTNNPNGH